jgi:hypothetical protein
MHNEDKAAKAATKKGEALTPSTTNPMNAGKLVKAQSDQTVAKPSETLSADEREVLAEHEGTIKQGLQTFQDVGMAFAQIRDLGLYREHGTFDDYCRDVWKVCRSKAYRYMAAGKCVKGLECRRSATNEPLAIPATETQARKMATRTPEQQFEIAKNVAKRTSSPTAKDFDEETDKFSEDRARVQSYNIGGEETDEVENVAEKEFIPVTAPVLFDAGLIQLKELTDMAVLAYNTFSNSTKTKEVEKTLWKLKEGLKAWAAWQAKQLNQKEVV